MIVVPKKLLAADEPVPVSVYKERGKSPFLLVADHAGNRIPRALGRLGIAKEDCQRHIAWDIGVAGLGRRLANVLDATLIQQTIHASSLTATARWRRAHRSPTSVKILRSPAMPD